MLNPDSSNTQRLSRYDLDDRDEVFFGLQAKFMPCGAEKKAVNDHRQIPSDTLIFIRKQREKIKLLSENGNSIKHRNKIVALRI